MGAATVATGLIAGAFYVFTCAVMPGLARSDDQVFVEVMRGHQRRDPEPGVLPEFHGGAGAVRDIGVAGTRAPVPAVGVGGGLTAYALAPSSRSPSTSH
ncbi:hypothetical protein ACRAWF_35690 [Streptomyces sp. L7]